MKILVDTQGYKAVCDGCGYVTQYFIDRQTAKAALATHYKKAHPVLGRMTYEQLNGLQPGQVVVLSEPDAVGVFQVVEISRTFSMATGIEDYSLSLIPLHASQSGERFTWFEEISRPENPTQPQPTQWLEPADDRSPAEKALEPAINQLIEKARAGKELEAIPQLLTALKNHSAEVWEAGHLHQHMAWHCVDCKDEDDGEPDKEIIQRSRACNPYWEGDEE